MDLLAIGTIRTAWGLKGWVKLSSFSGEWDHFESLDSILLRKPGEDRTREYTVEDFRMHQGLGMFKLAGVDSPEAGKRLAGFEILVPRDLAAPLGRDEWYLGDLTGLDLTDGSDGVYGRIVAVIESADDLLEVERPEGSRFLVPFRTEFVEEPDMSRRCVVLKAPWLAEES